MSPRTQEQFEEIRESRRQQIMDAALKLFASDGYGHCSISQLAASAGISKGLMYNYFTSKEDLLGEIIEHGLQEIMALFDPDQDGTLTSEELVGFIRKVFSIMRANQEFWILYISVILQPGVKEYLKDKPIIGYMEQFTSMLIEYFKKKGFDDPYLEMLTLSALIEGFGILMIYAYPSIRIPEEMMLKYENRIIEMYK
jgi:AcrR family transcriptional regulator